MPVEIQRIKSQPQHAETILGKRESDKKVIRLEHHILGKEILEKLRNLIPRSKYSTLPSPFSTTISTYNDTQNDADKAFLFTRRNTDEVMDDNSNASTTTWQMRENVSESIAFRVVRTSDATTTHRKFIQNLFRRPADTVRYEMTTPPSSAASTQFMQKSVKPDENHSESMTTEHHQIEQQLFQCPPAEDDGGENNARTKDRTVFGKLMSHQGSAMVTYKCPTAKPAHKTGPYSVTHATRSFSRPYSTSTSNPIRKYSIRRFRSSTHPRTFSTRIIFRLKLSTSSSTRPPTTVTTTTKRTTQSSTERKSTTTPMTTTTAKPVTSRMRSLMSSSSTTSHTISNRSKTLSATKRTPRTTVKWVLVSTLPTEPTTRTQSPYDLRTEVIKNYFLLPVATLIPPTVATSSMDDTTGAGEDLSEDDGLDATRRPMTGNKHKNLHYSGGGTGMKGDFNVTGKDSEAIELPAGQRFGAIKMPPAFNRTYNPSIIDFDADTKTDPLLEITTPESV
ncbi:unnamed protein product [Notodromas monacha]|uniref:Uncharacterized protein n=1 Tax=Notodromas monacha TaxID=399045 RepID=A0A7R9GGW8_9CRUS|nr:unnamed protein product [Notodromas monacha]CAG0920309.1 unnamed protein product [Notodromas monacha]